MIEHSRCAPTDGLSLHVIHRGHNKMNVFADDYDHQVFVHFLSSLVARFELQVHAFAVLSTHDHLIVTPPGEVLPTAMKSLATRYTKYFNAKYERLGTVWMGRYRTKLIRNERYALTCLRYIDQNPVRANLAVRPEQYRWSSHAAYVSGMFPSWLTPHPAYVGLASTAVARQQAYQALFAQPVSDAELVDQRY